MFLRQMVFRISLPWHPHHFPKSFLASQGTGNLLVHRATCHTCAVKEGDVVNSKADREKLREAIALLLPEGRQFNSTDHLKEFVLESAGPWGFPREHARNQSISFAQGTHSGKAL
jgi:hypothetical protein